MESSEKSMNRVDLMLTNSCNSNCLFCYLKGIKDKKFDFSFKKIKNTLVKGKERGFKEIYISGGEPTLNNELFKIIKKAKKLGYEDIKIMTNGLRLSYNNYLQMLLKAGLNNIAFSLHGADEKTHDIHTRVPGSFKLTTKAIKNAVKNKNKVFTQINIVITKYNIKKLPDIIKFAIFLGVESVHAQLIVPNSKESKALFPEREDIVTYFKKAFDMYKDKLDITFAFVPFCYLKGYEHRICEFDFTTNFFSNTPKIFELWRDSLLASKVVKEECKICKYLDNCRGHWKVK